MKTLDLAEKVLTKKDVEKVKCDGSNEFLDDVTAIDDEAAVVLGKRNFYLPLNKLRQLSVTAARALAQTDSHLCLDGLTSLTPALLEALANRPKDSQSLSLNGLTTMTADEAQTLALVECGRLELGITSLSDTIAKVLAQREGTLSLGMLTTISDAAAAELAKIGGDLWLNGLTTLSDKAAKSLSKLKSKYLYLDGLKSLSQAACVTIAKKVGGYGYSADPMKPGTPVDEWRSEAENARDPLFFRLLFADRGETRAKKVRKYCESPDGKAAIEKVEAQIDADSQSGRLNFLDCSSMSVDAAVKLASHSDGIRCPGFLGFSDAEEKDHDWHAVGDAVVRFLQKVPGHGPRCAALGGLLIELMLASGQTRALGELLRVAREIKITETRQWIETRVAWKAQETGTSTQAIEDATIDTHGFGEPTKKLAKAAKRAKASNGAKAKKR